MKPILQFLVDRLKEKSTWVSILNLAILAGATLTDEQGAAITTAAVAIVSVVGVFLKEKTPVPVTPVDPPKPTPLI